MQDIQYRGTPVFFAGKEWIVPSLSIGQFEDSFDKLTAPSEGEGLEAIRNRFASFIPIIGSAIRRNYPDVKDEDLRGHLDLRTFRICLNAIQNAAGLEEGAPGEA